VKTVYVASKVKHAALWRELRASGVRVVSTWIDEAEPNQSLDMADLWGRCVREAGGADALICYLEPGDVLKGGLVEVGCALASGRPVYVVGEPDGSWVHHTLVRRAESVQHAVELITRGANE
jgi:nucleoside 2-deoxyribosyltransferase